MIRKPFIDFNLSMNETMRQTFGEPIIDMDLTLEQTFDRFLDSAHEYKELIRRRYEDSLANKK